MQYECDWGDGEEADGDVVYYVDDEEVHRDALCAGHALGPLSSPGDWDADYTEFEPYDYYGDGVVNINHGNVGGFLIQTGDIKGGINFG